MICSECKATVYQYLAPLRASRCSRVLRARAQTGPHVSGNLQKPAAVCLSVKRGKQRTTVCLRANEASSLQAVCLRRKNELLRGRASRCENRKPSNGQA